MKSQENQILEYLRRGKEISPILALKMFGCFRLASRISDLRNAGHQIFGKMVEHQNKRFKVYYMENSQFFKEYGRNY